MKKTLTEQQLRTMILDRARQVPDCEDVRSIGFYHVIEPGMPNWSLNAVGAGNSSFGTMAVIRIAEELAAEYDVQWPATVFDKSTMATVFTDGADPGTATPLFQAGLENAVRWARLPKTPPAPTYAIWIQEPGKPARWLLVEEMAWLFKQVA